MEPIVIPGQDSIWQKYTQYENDYLNTLMTVNTIKQQRLQAMLQNAQFDVDPSLVDKTLRGEMVKLSNDFTKKVTEIYKNPKEDNGYLQLGAEDAMDVAQLKSQWATDMAAIKSVQNEMNVAKAKMADPTTAFMYDSELYAKDLTNLSKEDGWRNYIGLSLLTPQAQELPPDIPDWMNKVYDRDMSDEVVWYDPKTGKKHSTTIEYNRLLGKTLSTDDKKALAYQHYSEDKKQQYNANLAFAQWSRRNPNEAKSYIEKGGDPASWYADNYYQYYTNDRIKKGQDIASTKQSDDAYAAANAYTPVLNMPFDYSSKDKPEGATTGYQDAWTGYAAIPIKPNDVNIPTNQLRTQGDFKYETKAGSTSVKGHSVILAPAVYENGKVKLMSNSEALDYMNSIRNKLEAQLKESGKTMTDVEKTRIVRSRVYYVPAMIGLTTAKDGMQTINATVLTPLTDAGSMQAVIKAQGGKTPLLGQFMDLYESASVNGLGIPGDRIKEAANGQLEVYVGGKFQPFIPKIK